MSLSLPTALRLGRGRPLLRALLLACAAGSAVPALARNSLDLAGYTLAYQFALPGQPGAAAEASAITYNWDRGTLFVVGDEAEAIVEVTRTGVVVGSMRLSGFDDTEGLTYVGNGQFVLAEERTQDLYRLNYVAGSTASRAAAGPAYNLGSYSNNQGIEGLSWDPRDGSFIAVKEKNPQAIYSAQIDFSTGSGNRSTLFDASRLGLQDLADVQVLSTVGAFAGQAVADNLLVISQESRLLVETTRQGQVLGSLNLRFVSGTAEGVTIDERGYIYITQEQPSVFVYRPASPVPEPGAFALMAGGLALLGWRARRRAA